MADMFDFLADPSAYVALLTLVVMEIVLGIDNLVFISILSSRLPAGFSASRPFSTNSLPLLNWPSFRPRLSTTVPVSSWLMRCAGLPISDRWRSCSAA